MSLCLLVGAAAAASEQQIKLAGLDVTVWSDAAVASKRQPVLLFSHGFRGCATQSRFLMEAFARAGYLVFAPNHRDASCLGAGRPDRTGASFRSPDAWTDAVFRDRADDLRQLRDAIALDARFASRIDLSRIGLVGVTPAIHKTSGAYEQSPAPKYFVDFEGASHFAWTNFGTVARQSIVDYSVAFVDRYVKGAPPAAILTEKRAGVAVFRYATAESGGVTVERAREEASAQRR